MPAGAVAAALKKKAPRPLDKTKPSFYTPARYGWGQVARELHPAMAQVWHSIYGDAKLLGNANQLLTPDPCGETWQKALPKAC